MKLGYGGTKTEMERLLKDAEEISGVKYDISSFGDIVQAIHVIQDEMGITGTTSKEAEKTISGSLGAMKSSWSNLLTAMASGENLDQCVDNMVNSVEIFAGNVMPVAEKALYGLGTVVERLAPIIAEKLPDLADKLLPPLIKATISLAKGLIKALPNIIRTVFQTVGDILGEQFPALKSFGNFFAEHADKIAKFIPILLGLVGAFMAFNKIKSIGSVLGGLFGGGKGGKSGGSKGGFLGSLTKNMPKLAKLKPTVILKGMANLAIIFGGFTVLAVALMAVSPLLAKIGDTASIVKMIAIIGILGIVGGVLSKFAETAGRMQITSVLMGIANMAIVFAGLSALFLLVGALSLVNFDLGRVMGVVGIIGAIGIVGALLTPLVAVLGVAGVWGMAAVALGLVNMAILMAGMSGLVLLLNEVAKVPIEHAQLLKLVSVIGIVGMIGAALGLFVGTVGAIPFPLVLSGLTNIGLALGGITLLIVAFGKMAKTAGFTEFLESGGAILVKVFNIIGQIAGAIIGGIGESLTKSLPAMGENLSKFATSLQPMFKVFEGVDMSGVGDFFGALGTFLLKMSGGKLLDFFTGGVDFSGISEGLNQLATNGVKNFFTMVNGIDEGAFNKGKLFFECMDGISNLPNTGGIGQLFGGENDFSGVATGLGQLAGEGVKNFFAMVGGFEETAFDNAKLFFEALDGISKLPNSGGFAQLFSGKNDFSGVASGLEKLASDGVQKFFNMVNTLDLDNLNGLWSSLKDAGKITTENLGSVIDESIDTIVEKIRGLPRRMAIALQTNSDTLSSGFVEMWKAAIEASVAPVNKLLDGANHILKEFGSKKKLIEWTPYARGTSGHKGGNALVNDGNGAELVQMPNGNTFIPNGRNVFIPNAPQGMKVMPADQTAQIMGRSTPTFNYAKGIGKIDIWSYYDNAKGLVDKISENISYKGMSDFASNLGKSMVSTFSGEMPAWIEKLFEENGQSIDSYVASKGVAQWLPTVVRALKMEGQYSLGNIARTLFQMKTESGGNPMAINNWDSNAKKGTPSKGLMQVIDPTFNAYARKGFNKNIYDPLSNILASIRYAVSRYGSLSKAYRGVGYANGGIATKPSIFGEDGAEMAIPLSRNKRKRGVSLWAQTGEMLGLSNNREGGNERVSYIVENNTYSPELQFNIYGSSGDERSLMRKIKNTVREALNDMVDDVARSSPKCKEV